MNEKLNQEVWYKCSFWHKKKHLVRHLVDIKELGENSKKCFFSVGGAFRYLQPRTVHSQKTGFSALRGKPWVWLARDLVWAHSLRRGQRVTTWKSVFRETASGGQAFQAADSWKCQMVWKINSVTRQMPAMKSSRCSHRVADTTWHDEPCPQPSSIFLRLKRSKGNLETWAEGSANHPSCFLTLHFPSYSSNFIFPARLSFSKWRSLLLLVSQCS